MPKKQSVSASSSEAEMAEDEQSEISIPDDIIAQDTDSLQTLLSDLRDSLAIAAEKLQPLQQKLDSQELPSTAQGLSYLEVKYNLMLCYCQCLTYFVLLKVEGDQDVS